MRDIIPMCGIIKNSVLLAEFLSFVRILVI